MFEKLHKQYKEITVENTVKLLIRCKMSFHCRRSLLEIFKLIVSYELSAVTLKNLIDEQDNYKLPLKELTQIQVSADKLYENGHSLLVQIN